MRFFPIDADEKERCDENSYADPNVPMTELPSDAFRSAIDAVTPKSASDWLSGTPTLAVVGRYDDPASPTRIELCESTCDHLKEISGAVLNVDFGCARREAIR